MKTVIFALAAVAMMVGAGAAQAASITPVFADCDPAVQNWNGTGVACGGAGETDATAVNLGAPDGNYYSLGLETTGVTGVAVFSLSPAVSGTLYFHDAVGSDGAVGEAADIFLANGDINGNFDGSTAVYVGTIDNGNGGAVAANNSVSFLGSFQFLYLQDASKTRYQNTNSTNGYDLDSVSFVSISAVPLPAGIVLLGSALFGFGALRLRRG